MDKYKFGILGTVLAIGFASLSVANATDEQTKDVVDVTVRAQQEVEKLLQSPSGCNAVPVCAASDPCDDLFKASCTNEDGSFKDDVKLEKQVDEKIKAAREAALKEFGSASVKDAYLDFLRKNGYEPKSDLSDEQIEKLLAGKTPNDLSEWFSNIPKDCYGLVKLSTEEDATVSKLRNDIWPKQYQLSNAQSTLESVKGQREAMQKLRDATTDKNSQKGYDQQIAEYTKRISEIEEEIKTKKAEYEAAQDKVDAIYSAVLSRGKESMADFNKRVMASYEKDPNALVSSIMQVCSDSIPRNLEEKKKTIKDKENELADKAAAQAAVGNTGNASTEIINPEIAKLEVPKECAKPNLYEMRDAAVQLHRVKDRDAATVAAKAFVEKYYDFYGKVKAIERKLWNTQLTIYSSSSQTSSTTATPARKDLSTEISPLQTEVSNVCSDYKGRAQNGYYEAYGKFFGNIAKSKPAIESILAATYGKERKARMDAVYKRVHSGIMSFISNELGNEPGLKGTPKLARMKESMAKLGYSWLEPPAKNLYKKEDDFPLPVLDFEKLPLNEMFLGVFQDPTLSFFKEMNAFYNPAMKQGVLEVEEKVNLLPTLNLLMEKDPYAAMAVLAHEIGHKIGFQVSKMNGYDLTKVYAKLTDCLASQDSINMLNLQADEAISDWIASKVMGRMIMTLPEKERKAAALRVGGFFCLAYGDNFYKYPVATKYGHPESTLRINGIYGANSDIRKALGCTGEKTKGRFKECYLQGEKK
ncbi:MAG: hypothetical protein A2428_02590 [Bdellovibrionales bacterium RIFOXYC1_FULL_54_43]|nr:MAG: hypothetical protein A2428_02590 [Bdellovibrionales bacterium RIFOXYC1_FULL_54_43]OFZ82574.1 MAG: hypothetical protein A2603_15045 [Bdellovibrionales bacterium RIFOXYD1_FULL_55_31]